MHDMNLKAAENLRLMREKKPLVHNITNYVVMSYTANALLAAGASPVMAHAENEVSDMVALAGSLVLNIGTLSDPWIRAMLIAGREANRRNIPVILDPVGSGATRLRTETAREILREVKVAVVRGNASEVLSLATDTSTTKGVDSVHTVNDVALIAFSVAKQYNSVVAITGKIDLITNGVSVYRVGNGHELMTSVTGTGCTATAIIAAFCAVNPIYLQAATFALGYFGLAGEKAAVKHTTPGSYGLGLIDALYEITPEELRTGLKLEI